MHQKRYVFCDKGGDRPFLCQSGHTPGFMLGDTPRWWRNWRAQNHVLPRMLKELCPHSLDTRREITATFHTYLKSTYDNAGCLLGRKKCSCAMMAQRPLRLLLLKMSNLSLQDTQQGPQCGLGHETVSLFSSLGWEVGEGRSMHFHGITLWTSRLYRLDENAGPNSPCCVL